VDGEFRVRLINHRKAQVRYESKCEFLRRRASDGPENRERADGRRHAILVHNRQSASQVVGSGPEFDDREPRTWYLSSKAAALL